MKLPLSLIKTFIDIDLPAAQIGEILTLAGIEVDRIYNETPRFAGLIAVDVIATKPHPDAKNLQIADIFDGKTNHRVVCGAPNCRAGMKTAFAPVGAILGEKRIEKVPIRGIESPGMLCSASELFLTEDGTQGIFDFPQDVKTGQDLVDVLWDPVFELSLTPNLGHCMSALGIARELSAALQIPLRRKERTFPKLPLDKQVHVQDAKLVPSYLCLEIDGIDVGPSPFWLQRVLEACGFKPINRIVDATQYVMIKTGQPLHAFDLDLLEGNIKVGPAHVEESFLGLDGQMHEIAKGSLVISDAKKTLAIAGVIGGANSAVSITTKRVFLEGACFDPMAVRQAARRAAVRTESSARFEKGVDPSGIAAALMEAFDLMGGRIRGAWEHKSLLPPKIIAYRVERINQLLGTKLSKTEVEEIFERLGFKILQDQVEVPTHRMDIHEEIDLVEEVARIYGYNNIDKKRPLFSSSQVPTDPQFLFERAMRNKLVALGLTEFLNCDLIGPKLAEMAQMIVPPSMEPLKALYSKSEEYSVLRVSLLPALLQSVKTNFDKKNKNVQAFEIGRIHFVQGAEAIEIPMAAILLTGSVNPSHWSQDEVEVDYFDLKGIVERLVDAAFAPSSHLALHPGRQADIKVGDLTIGSMGEVHPLLLEKMGMEGRIYYAELNLLPLRTLHDVIIKVEPLAQFPSSERDWTLPLDMKKWMADVFHAIDANTPPILEKVELIDLYLPEGALQKNATLRFTYRDKSKTVSFEEVDREHAKMMERVAKLLAK